MPIAEFEEKEYEIPLYLELADRSPYVWSPGQVLEKRLGLDGIQFSLNSTFWRVVSRNQTIPSGIALNSFAHNLNIFHRQLPSFRCNLMLQVKRPTYLKRQTLGYQGPAPYFRFSLDINQQNVLANLANQVGKRAFIAYASPSFSKCTELYWNTVNSSLIVNSAFADVIPLIGHNHWAYLGPGTSGQAYSEPQNIKGVPLMEVLERLVRIDNEWKYSHEQETSQYLATEALGSLKEKIYKALEEESKTKNDIAREALKWIRHLDSSWTEKPPLPIQHFASIQFFCSIFDLLWFTVG